MILVLRILLFSAFGVITALAFLPDYSGLPDAVSISDFLNHTTAFATLYILWRFSFNHTSRTIMTGLMLYGVIIEFVQFFLPTRSASLEDIAADTAGMLIGFLIYRIMHHAAKRAA